MNRSVPYGNFNFRVKLGNDEVIGGFSDVSGLNSEINIAEYRAGNSPENHVTKIPGVHKFENVTLKRGIVDSKAFWDWMKEAWTTGPKAKRDMKIEMLDEAHQPVQSWVLAGAVPSKYTGPTLAGAGGTEVAMEEWQITYDMMKFDQPA
ncbi:MAG: phage tail protein [Paracoccaceae bacterium]